MREIDIVKLNRDFEDLKKGTEGTIVLDYDDKMCEVEFVDEKKRTIGVYTTPKSYLILVKSYNN